MNKLLKKITEKQAEPALELGVSPKPQAEQPKQEQPKQAKHSHKGLKNGEKCPDCGKIHRCSHGPKQSTRLLKASCLDCDWIIRLSQKAASMGLPNCPVCLKKITLD